MYPFLMQTIPHSKLSTGIIIIIIIISSTLLLSQIPKQFLSCKTHPQMNQLFAKTAKNHTKCTRHPKTIHCILISVKILLDNIGSCETHQTGHPSEPWISREKTIKT
jgi:hypothetical protein